MINVFLPVLVIFYMQWSICWAQDSNQLNDRYLMIVDIQEFDFKDEALNNSVIELAHTVSDLVGRFDPDRVIYIKSGGKALSISFKGIHIDTLETRDLHDNLKIVGKNIFTKMGGDSFTSAELTDFLEKNHVKEIVLTGLLAERCVYDTALGGIERGYDISIIPEAVLGKTEKKKEKALKKLQMQGIKILHL